MRSFLIAPANRHDLVAKFPRFGADCCVIDLEDGTPQAEKAAARAVLAKAIGIAREGGFAGTLAVRVNEPASDGYLDDLAAAFACGIDAVVIPKVEDADALWPARHHIGRLAKAASGGPRPFIIAGIETGRGVLQASAVCRPEYDVRALYFGAEDLASSVGGRRTPSGREVEVARSMVLMVAKAAGLVAIDQAVIDIRDDVRYLAEAAAARDLGYDGKTCLTPGQVQLAHQAFSPSEEERAFAARLVRAYDDALAKGVGVIEFEGRMVDGPVYKQAQRVMQG